MRGLLSSGEPGTPPEELGRAAPRTWVSTTPWSNAWRARWRPSCRTWRATAVSSPRIRARARRAQDPARREPAPDRRPAEQLRGRNRHRLAQDSPQQRARLFHRGQRRPGREDAERSGIPLHPSPDLASAVRYTTVELSELEKKISSAAEKALALEVKLFEDLVARSRAAPRRSAWRRARWPKSMSRRRSPRSRPRAAGAGPGSTIRRASRSPAAATRWSNRRWPRPRKGLRRQRLRSGLRRPGVAGDRSQHGRQEHLPAPERADRRARPDGLFRARRGGPISASSTACSAGSAPPTTWRAGAPPSWSRWSRRR